MLSIVSRCCATRRWLNSTNCARPGTASHTLASRGGSDVRRALASGIRFVEQVIEHLGSTPEGFCGRHIDACRRIVDTATDDASVIYQAKLERAQERFSGLRARTPPGIWKHLIGTLSNSPRNSPHHAHQSTRCPACGSGAWLSGREYLDDWLDAGAPQAWFAPKLFQCRVCELTLDGPELGAAGFET